MYREKINELKKWKNSKNRKPLILKGARQVGKTWIMQEFGKTEYEKCAYINFDDNARMKSLYQNDFDIERIIQGLKIESGVNIEPENTLIILDEIQEVPMALKSLKYFNENANQYHVIAAGSLLGVALHKGTSFPVGKVDFIEIKPFSYFEFLDAIEQTQLLELIKNNDYEMINVFKTKFLQYFKLYLYVGGMPEVIRTYIETKDFIEVRNIQNKILEGYKQDFSKYAPTEIVPRINQLWKNIPTQLAKENKKFIYGIIREGARAREYETALAWLIDCGLVYQVYRVNDNKIPLSGYQDFKAFKLYMLDVGLFAAMSKLDAKTLLEGNDIYTEFKGSMTEEYVLTQLKQNANLDVFYWTSKDGISEVDFIMQIGAQNVPVEVKASENLNAKSLKTFIKKYDNKINVRTSTTDYKIDELITNIPLYLIENIEKIILNNII